MKAVNISVSVKVSPGTQKYVKYHTVYVGEKSKE